MHASLNPSLVLCLGALILVVGRRCLYKRAPSLTILASQTLLAVPVIDHLYTYHHKTYRSDLLQAFI